MIIAYLKPSFWLVNQQTNNSEKPVHQYTNHPNHLINYLTNNLTNISTI